MEVKNQLHPDQPGQIESMMEPGPDGPITMVNLLKFREKAEYADGRESDLTGREAYQIYGAAVLGLIEKHGGRFVFAGAVSHLTLGIVDDLWDQVALVEYPNRKALLDMSLSDEYQEISIHRDAGLEGQLNIETVSGGLL